MFHKNIKLILAGLIVATGIWQFTESNIGNGIFLLLVSAIPVFLYFKNEFILLAFLKLRKQDFEGAKSWLDKIKNPEGALVQKQQGYFNYLHGIMLSQTNINQSEKFFKKSDRVRIVNGYGFGCSQIKLSRNCHVEKKKIRSHLTFE